MVFVITGLQTAAALLLIIGEIAESNGGHDELRDASLLVRIAFKCSWGYGIFAAWALSSLIGVVGAMRPIESRRRWLLMSVAASMLCVAIFLSSYLILGHSAASWRWVYPNAPPYSWQRFKFDGQDYMSVLLMALITNPLLIVVAYRLVRKSYGSAEIQNDATH